ncbi:MAG TPA: Gfo/Idh/MocA family oxidoreductase [Victivallales bacterium]|nr:Gfo/Idh/MocA family oxidoreductase [Victivallales bacterium]
MNCVFIGCGYVAGFYFETLCNYPELKLIGVMDSDIRRSKKFSEYASVPYFNSLDEVLKDDRVDIIVNLTSVKSHYEISKAGLNAGKHVYSEKPLAFKFEQAKALIKLAKEKNLYISSAPCNLLGETAQTLWKALRKKEIGDVHLVYAEIDDGLIHKMDYKSWITPYNIAWPHEEEFEIGCTLEHTAYVLTWLVTFFGPVKTVTAFSSRRIKDKKTDKPLKANGPDFSSACLQFESGVVARITNSIIASRNHTISIFGEDGMLFVENPWDYRSPVNLIRDATEENMISEEYPLVGKDNPTAPYFSTCHHMDFCRGIYDIVEAVRKKTQCRLTSQFALHITEVTLAISNAGETSESYKVTTIFQPIKPMDWAL